MQQYPISLQRLESRHTAKKLLQMIHTYRTTIDMGITSPAIPIRLYRLPTSCWGFRTG